VRHDSTRLQPDDLLKLYLIEESMRARLKDDEPVISVQKTTNAERTGYICVPNVHYYHLLRGALATKGFCQVDGIPWPTFQFKNRKIRGLIQLRPLVVDGFNSLSSDDKEVRSKIMHEHNEQLTDLDVDVLDSLFALCAKQPQASDEAIMVSIDDVLIMRGLQKKISGEGRRGGFRPKQRRQILAAISRLQNLYLDVHIDLPGLKRKDNQLIQGRPFIITDCEGNMQPDGFTNMKRFLFHPGEVITYFLQDSWRQAAWLSVKVLQFDPYRQQWAKRVARYLSWQWRIRAGKSTYLEPYRVVTLLEAVGISPDVRNPNRTLERLEKALNALHEEGVIAGLQYDRWESMDKRRGWLKKWLQWTVTIEPPNAIKEHYKAIARHETPPPKAHVRAEHLGQQIQALRKRLGFTQLQVAEDLGIDRTYLSRLESGNRGQGRNSSQLKKVKRWLERYGHD